METKQMIVEKGKAGYAAIYLLSPEEQRSLRELKRSCQDLERNLFIWTVGKGLVHDYNPGQVVNNRQRRNQVDTETPPLPDSGSHPELMEKMKDLPEKSVVVLRLFHHFLDDVLVQASLMDLIPKYKLSKRMIVVLTPVKKLPAELEKEFALLEIALPTKEELLPVLDGIVKNLPNELKPSDDKKKELVEAALGLTTTEAENAFSLSIIRPRMMGKEDEIWDSKIVMSEKCQTLKKTDILEYIPTSITGLSAVGGMDNLKEFVRKRRRAFTEEARAYGLPTPKGILLIGPPGTGKSLGAKAISSELHLPLLRLDMGKVYGGLVGQSESNIRMALGTAEAMSPCILWVDEIEKGMASGGGNLDSGVGQRVLGTVLTWMQEKVAPVYVYATSNRPNLPTELVRKGRFDEMFSVDLPTGNERKEIFRIHLDRLKIIQDVIKGDKDYDYLTEHSDAFTGAEIEAAVIDSMFTAFDDNSRKVALHDVINALQETQPQAKIMAEDIRNIRDWCKTRTRPANRGDLSTITVNVGGRAVEA